MRRLLLLVLAALLALGAAPASAQDAAPESSGSVLVVGVPGLRWDDVGQQTPTLAALARDGASGVLSVKAVPAVTCPADGWLTLGAGNRALAAGVPRDPCGANIPPPSAFADQVAANRDEREGAELGALADALDGCVSVEGAGPVLAVAPESGRPTAGTPCQVALREAPAVAGQGTGRAAAAVAADRRIGILLRELDPDTVLVVGLSEALGEDLARLHVALARGPGFPPGELRSGSTRRAPYVQLIDVAPTVLDVLGLAAPGSMTGQPWRSVGAAPSPAQLADLAQKAAAHKAVTVPFFVALLAGELLLFLLALWRRRPDLAELVTLGGVAALGASYAANLLPWWRAPAPLLTLLAVVVVIATAVVALATCRSPLATPGPEARVLRPVGIVCAVTAAVLLLDLVTGAHLQMSSVAGYSPLVAGRFAGIGNVAFGVLAASVLLATAALTRRPAAVAAVGVVAVVVDGAPPWGSDVGGVLALVPAFVLLGLLLSGRRVSVARLVAAGLAGAIVVTALALADWSRPEPDRTHLGRFVQDVADGTAGTLLRRKADAVLGLVFSSPVTAGLPLLVAVAVYLVLRPPAPLAAAFARAPAWRAGLLATGLASAIGFVVNDSGAAVPAMAITVAAPATGAVVLRARRASQDPPSLLA